MPQTTRLNTTKTKPSVVDDAEDVRKDPEKKANPTDACACSHMLNLARFAIYVSRELCAIRYMSVDNYVLCL